MQHMLNAGDLTCLYIYIYIYGIYGMHVIDGMGSMT